LFDFDFVDSHALISSLGAAPIVLLPWHNESFASMVIFELCVNDPPCTVWVG
jgi:hypothetical protein